jgi:hypothetical protein
MEYDKHRERTWRDFVRFLRSLKETSDSLLVEATRVVSPAELVSAFVAVNPVTAGRYRQALLDRIKGRPFILRERRWRDRLQLARAAIWPRG